MQSSFMNLANARLSAASHSDGFSSRASSARGRLRESVQSRSTTRKRPSLAFVSPSRPRRKISRAVAPTPPASRKPNAERARGDDRKVRAQLAGDVRGLADLVAQRLGRSRELLALGFDLAADLVDGAWQLLRPLRLQRLGRQLRLADRLLGHGRRSLLDLRRARDAEHPGEQNEIRGHDQQREPRRHAVASAAAIVAKAKPTMKNANDRGADHEADADAERRRPSA